MKILLFSATLTSYETVRLVKTARRMGHELVLVPYQSLIVSLGDAADIDVQVGSNVDRYRAEAETQGCGDSIAQAGMDLTSADVVLTRSANRSKEPMRANYAGLLHSYFLRHAIPMLNGHSSTVKASNKLWQAQLLVDAGLPIVPTRFIAHEDLLEEAVSTLRWPLFTKGAVGTHGKGAGPVQSNIELREAYSATKQPAYLLVQQSIDSKSDIRALVLGDQVLGAIRRTAAQGQAVTNISAGGTAETVSLSSEETDLVVRATKAVGCEFSGVDLMHDRDGQPYILETNKNPQFQGFEAETGLDVPKAIFNYLEKVSVSTPRPSPPD